MEIIHAPISMRKGIYLVVLDDFLMIQINNDLKFLGWRIILNTSRNYHKTQNQLVTAYAKQQPIRKIN